MFKIMTGMEVFGFVRLTFKIGYLKDRLKKLTLQNGVVFES